MVKGIERQDIFRDDQDKEHFVKRLGMVIQETSTSCYAWSLLSNHVHLLLRTGHHPIATVMRRLLTGYALGFNRRYNRHGQLFQNRYKSILCQEDPYFLALIRYIHLNPLRAGIVDRYQDLETYAYCGHGVITGKQVRDWQDRDFVLSFFDNDRKTAQGRYEDYVYEGIEQGPRPDLVGGGLIRSLGGWEEARKLGNEERRQKADERILGDSQFVMDVLRAADEHFERRYELKAMGVDLDALARKVEKLFGMDPGDVYLPGKYKRLIRPRSVFCYWAVRELGETATSIARKLGLTQSGVSKAVSRGEKIVREMNLKLP